MTTRWIHNRAGDTSSVDLRHPLGTTSAKTHRRRRRLWGISIACMLGVLGIGWGIASWESAEADRQLRTQLLVQAQAVAMAVQPERLRNLGFSADDVNMPDFKRVCADFAAWQTVARPRFGVSSDYLGIYSMQRFADGIRFGPEGIPASDPRASLPGTVYKEPPPEVVTCFDRRESVTVGPYRDEYGQWVSAFSPIVNPDNNEVLMVVGIDVDAGQWANETSRAAHTAWLITILFLLYILLGALLLQRRDQVGPVHAIIRHAEVILVVVAGVGLSAVLAAMAHCQEVQARQVAFEEVVNVASDQLNARLRKIGQMPFDRMPRALSVDDPNPTSDPMASEIIAQFVNCDAAIRSVEWIPMVSEGQRTAWEASVREHSPAFTVYQPTANGGREPASTRAWYYPVLWIEPETGHETRVGFDYGAESARLNMLLEATRTRQVTASSPIRRQHPDGGQVVFIAQAVYGSGTDTTVLPRGFVVAELDPRLLVSGLRGATAIGSAGAQVEIRLDQVSGDALSLPVVLNSNAAVDSGPLDSTTTAWRPVFGLGKSYSMTAAMGPGFLSSHRLRYGEIAGGVGLILTALIAGLIAMLVANRRELEGRIARRVMEITGLQTQHEVMINHLSDGVVVHDRSGRIISCNPAAERILGISRDDILNTSAVDHKWRTLRADRTPLPDSEHPAMIALRTGEAQSEVTMEIIRSDGSAAWISVNADPLRRSPGGDPYAVVVSWHDITKQRHAQEQLEQTQIELASKEEQLRLALDGSGVGMWDWYIQEDRVVWSRTWTTMLGYEPSELHGTIAGFTALLHPEDHGAVMVKIQENLDQITALMCTEFRLRHKAGHWVWVLSSGRVMSRDAAGKPLRMLGTHVEITKLKQVAAALEAGREAAEAGMRSKNEFLAMMSHEIRTPMNGIMGMVELLLSTKLDSEQEDYAHTAYRSSEALLTIINDILDFSKLDANRLVLEHISFDLHQLVFDVVELFRPRVTGSTLELMVRIAPDLQRRVLGDPGRIRQILINLISNAVKFTAAGHVFIEVDQDGPHLKVKVEDTGIGIPQDKLATLFTPFTQGDASTARRYGGTGLGLVISRRLAEMMGGTLTVVSTANVGSTFSLSLPLAADADVVATPASTKDLVGQRILVVDDDRINCMILSEQLGLLGARVSTQINSAVALIEISAAATTVDPFVAVIIDQHMPGLDGCELGKAIRADPALSATSLILVTASGARGDAQRMSALGFTGYLTKPVRIEILGAVIATAIDRHRRGIAGLVTRHVVAEDRSGSASAPLRIKAKVLVVEDNLVNQKLVRIMLARHGILVDVAGNGREALAVMAVQVYDLVLMDCQMPEMDGFETTQAIRIIEARTGGRRVPIIAMTANVLASDREQCLAAGMDEFITKPVQAWQVQEMLQRWLNGRKTTTLQEEL